MITDLCVQLSRGQHIMQTVLIPLVMDKHLISRDEGWCDEIWDHARFHSIPSRDHGSWWTSRNHRAISVDSMTSVHDGSVTWLTGTDGECWTMDRRSAGTAPTNTTNATEPTTTHRTTSEMVIAVIDGDAYTTTLYCLGLGARRSQ